MSTVEILNRLHRTRFYWVIALVSKFVYFIKGNGFVSVKYHQQYRAYEFKVSGITYMSLGPGWAYTYAYLKNLLVDTYCYFYLPKDGDCVVDIGAGLGEESLILAQLVGAYGKVLSVEANPVTYGALAYACQVNSFTSCKPLNVALFETNTTVSIEDDAESYIGNTISNTSDKKSFQVRAVTFDTLVNENSLEKIDFLKLNIDGAEQFLLKGSDQSIGIVKNLCISCHDFRQNYHQHGEFYVTREKLRAFLVSKGFEITSRNTGNVVVDDFLYAKPKQ